MVGNELQRKAWKKNQCHAAIVTSLDSAAGRLRRGPEDKSQMKTKVRRLYDIANVLCTLDIIYKVQLTNKRKPVFAWKGTTSDAYTEPAIGVDALGAPISISEKVLLRIKNSKCDHAHEAPCLVVDTTSTTVSLNAKNDTITDSKTKVVKRKKSTMIKLKKHKILLKQNSELKNDVQTPLTMRSINVAR